MHRRSLRGLAVSHIFMMLLIAMILFAAKKRTGLASPSAFIAAVILMDGLYLCSFTGSTVKGRTREGMSDIIIFIWLCLTAWEIWTSVTALAHPVLIPSPENVFNVFVDQWKTILINIAYSMELLMTGMLIGLAVSTITGLYAGWNKRLHDFIYPVANVLAPIPAIVISPYLVLLMPSFRSASVLVIILGVFWPTLLGTMNRISGMDRRILDSARMLNPSNATMIWKVLLPYIFPGIISGLKVTMTTSMLMLNFAELMGATHGMGYFIQNSIAYANYTRAVAGIIVIGVVVTVLCAIITKLQKKLIWY